MFKYSDLPKPFLSLAPMEDVTDTVFRQMIAKWGAPDLFYTEFTNVDGLFSKGRESVIKRLKYTETERPLIAQIWGAKVENYYKAGELLKDMGFDGIDINMGCPVKKVVRRGSCSGLIRTPQLASEFIKATQEGSNGLPVSVKTRIGLSEVVTEEWIGFLLEHNLDLLTVHGRTTKQMTNVPNDWDEINKSRELRDKINPNTLIVGNGDVMSYEEAQDKTEKYKLDGIMVGRGIFGNPYIFTKDVHIDDLPIKERIQMLLDHSRLFRSTWGSERNFNVLKRYYKIYIKDFDGATEIRSKLMLSENLDDVEKILANLNE